MGRNGKIIPKIPVVQLLRHIVPVLVFLILPFLSAAQVLPRPADTVSAKITDTSVKSDSTAGNIAVDTAAGTSALEQQLGIRISPDALEEVVSTSARDSAVMDIRTNNFYLYGDAKVDYDGRKLSADRIDFNQGSNIATAREVHDTAQKKTSAPTFEQGTEKFTYEHLQYNFKSQRAIVRNAHSQYGEGFVHSEQVKRNADQSLYGYRNVYTTCALPHPHFGIRTNKIKIIPDQAIATGSANIEIEGVPTPLFLPFGYFPVNNENHRSGFILPGYTVEQNRGLGFMKGGYYFYLNDHVDLQLQTDIFTKGSFAGYLTSNYVTRYRYSGNVFLSYAINKTGEEFDPLAQISKSFAISWVHAKDAKSLPGINFNAKVDIQSGNYYTLTSFNTNQVLQNQFQSNITFSKNWANKPYSFTASATHNQNTASKQVNVTLPDMTFFLNPQNPFQRRNPVGASRWYEKITVGYSVNALNRITFYDTAFQLSQLQFDDFRNGMRHNVPVSANYNVARFITLSFNAAYNEYWNTMTTRRTFNDATQKIDTFINNRFAASRDFNASFNINTQIYGMKLFKRGAIRGFRHTLRPTLGLSYRPDFAKAPFNYYYETRLDSSQRLTYLSPYEQSIVGLPPMGKNGSVNFTLNNNLQMKVRNGKDTVTGFKNIALLDALDFTTAYNLAVDSFQWDFFRFSARTNIINLLNISASAVFDPYEWNYAENRRSTRTLQAAGKGLGRLTTAQLGFGALLRSKARTGNTNTAATNSEDYKSLMRNNGYGNYVDFNIPWSLNLTYTLDLEKRPSVYSLSDSAILRQNITLSGDFNFTPRWKMAFSTGYNTVEKQITYTSFDIYRDLHCWEMRLGLIPFGLRKSFNFSLNVKAQVLQDLKLTRRRSFFDSNQ